MSKLVKDMEFAALEKAFKGVRDLIMISPTKIHADLDVTFRKTLREKKIHVQMVKNTLAKRVLEAQGVKVDDKHWTGTTLVAWGADSIKDLSKAVDELIKAIEKKDPKNKEKYVVKTAVADGVSVPLSVAVKIPTRLEAIGEIVAAMLGAASEIAGGLTGPASQVASQIATIAEKKEDAPAAPAA
jgi:large subunit ribosomal protein L10